jgi:hypothetical protein
VARHPRHPSLPDLPRSAARLAVHRLLRSPVRWRLRPRPRRTGSGKIPRRGCRGIFRAVRRRM